MSNAQVLPFLRAQNQTRRPNGNSAMRMNDGMVAIQALQAIQGQEQSQRAFTSRLEDSLFLSHLRSGSSVLYLVLYSSTARGMPTKTLMLAMTESKSATMKQTTCLLWLTYGVGVEEGEEEAGVRDVEEEDQQKLTSQRSCRKRRSRFRSLNPKVQNHCFGGEDSLRPFSPFSAM